MTISRRHALFGLFSFGLMVFGFDTIRNLIAVTLDWENKHSSYVGMIPFITAVLLYSDRKNIFAKLKSSVLPAAAGFAIGAILYGLGRIYGPRLGENDHLALMTSALIVALLGGFLLIYGSAAFKAALFPLLFLFLTIPIPSRVMDGIVRLLQHGSASTVSLLFTLTGTPAYRDNVVFVLPGVTIEVAEACSGIRSTLAILVVTLLAAHMLLHSNWRRTALLLTVIPISLLKNAVRIVTLTLLAIHVDMSFLTGKLHNDGGIVFMMIGLGLMYPVLAILVRSEEKTYISNGARS